MSELFQAIQSWFTSSRAGLTYLVLLGAALVLIALAKLAAHSDAESRAGRVMEWMAMTALGVLMVLIIVGQPFNE